MNYKGKLCYNHIPLKSDGEDLNEYFSFWTKW